MVLSPLQNPILMLILFVNKALCLDRRRFAATAETVRTESVCLIQRESIQ